MNKFKFFVYVIPLLLCNSLAQNAKANPIPNMQHQFLEMTSPLSQACMAPPTPAGFYQKPQLVEILALTKEQIKSLRDIDYSFLTKTIKLRGDLELLQLAHEKLAVEKNETEAPMVIEKIAQLHADLFRLHAEARTAAAKVLKPEQIDLLESDPDIMASRRGIMR